MRSAEVQKTEVTKIETGFQGDHRTVWRGDRTRDHLTEPRGIRNISALHLNLQLLHRLNISGMADMLVFIHQN
jgi:hypothetical protein